MNITSAQPRLPSFTNRSKIKQNGAATERRRPVFSQERRHGVERRIANHNIPIDLRSGPDRRQQNRVSITT